MEEEDWNSDYFDKICEESAANAEQNEYDKDILEKIQMKERQLGFHHFSIEDHFRVLLDSPDGEHCVVVEGEEVISKLNNTITDTKLKLREKSPDPTAEMLASNRIGADESLNDYEGETEEKINEIFAEKEAKARATILEMVEDLPDTDVESEIQKFAAIKASIEFAKQSMDQELQQTVENFNKERETFEVEKQQLTSKAEETKSRLEEEKTSQEENCQQLNDQLVLASDNFKELEGKYNERAAEQLQQIESLQSALTEMETAKKDELNSAEERLDAIQQEKYQQVLKIEEHEQAKENVEQDNVSDNDDDVEFIKNKKKPSESAKETYSLLRVGYSVNEICRRRSLKRSTILGHLAIMIEDPEVEINPHDADVKIEHIVTVGRSLMQHPFLGEEELKIQVGSTVPWGDFKYSLAYLQSKTNTIRELRNLLASLDYEDEKGDKGDNITCIHSKDGFNK